MAETSVNRIITISEKLFLRPFGSMTQIKRDSNYYKGLILTLVLTGALLLFYYGTIIFSANSLAIGISGDGFKNYYTLAYYLKYDHGSHFTGMLYPYGEHVFFTDNQPLLAWALKLISYLLPDIVNHVNAIMIGLMFGSILIGGVYVYKSLVALGTNIWHSSIFAVLIILLSPQIYRIGGHFALSYTCFVPFIVFQTICYLQYPKSYSPLIKSLFVCIAFAFIHIYYAAISGLFFLSIAFTRSLLNDRDSKNKALEGVTFGILALWPLVMVKLFLILTDKVGDRPSTPWGFIETRATVANFLSHPYTFTSEAVHMLLPRLPIVFNDEGMGYIGLVPILTIGLLFLGLGAYFLKNRSLPNYAKDNSLFFLIPPAVIAMLVATAFPFCIDPFEKYYTQLPTVIKQFRASGRFNWIFYYITTLLSAWVISKWILKLSAKRMWPAALLMISVCTIWWIEVNMISIRTCKSILSFSDKYSPQTEQKKLLDNFNAIGKSPSDFQAILPLPFFLNGSELIYIENFRSDIGMKASLYTGLPLTACKMSRSSQSSTFKLANLLSSSLIKKTILNDMDKRPLLMVVQHVGMSNDELAMVEKGKLLFSDGDVSYYELPLSSFNYTGNQYKESLANGMSALFYHPNYLSQDSVQRVVLLDFDAKAVEGSFAGRGYKFNHRGWIELFNDTLPNLIPNSTYEFSIWTKVNTKRPAFPVFNWSLSNSDGSKYWNESLNPKFSTNTYGDWVYVRTTFQVKNSNDKLRIEMDGDYGEADELLIRPIDEDVITHYKAGGKFLYNNFPIE